MRQSATILVLAGALLFQGTVFADKVDDLIRAQMQEHHVPGVVVAVVHHGKEVKLTPYGTANLELNTPVTRDSVFEVGALTMEFTATAILLLEQQDKLSLEDQISRHLPNTPPAWRNVTVRHLLEHSSGIKSFTGVKEGGFELARHLTQAEFIQKIGAYPLEYQPGDKAGNSNTGYALLGYIVENVSGKKFWTFLDENVFRPSGMSSSGDRDPRIIVRNRVDGYALTKDGKIVNRDPDLTDMFASGAMLTSVPDLCKWETILDSEKLLSSDIKQRMWTPGKLNNGQQHTYALGSRVDTYKVFTRLSFTGSTAGFSCCFQRFPEVGLGIIVVSNLGDWTSGKRGTAHDIAQSIADMYLGAK